MALAGVSSFRRATYCCGHCTDRQTIIFQSVALQTERIVTDFTSRSACDTACWPSDAVASAPTCVTRSGRPTKAAPPTITVTDLLRLAFRSAVISEANVSSKASQLLDTPITSIHWERASAAASARGIEAAQATFQPARRKKASTMNRPKECVSPVACRSIMWCPLRCWEGRPSNSGHNPRMTFCR